MTERRTADGVLASDGAERGAGKTESQCGSARDSSLSFAGREVVARVRCQARYQASSRRRMLQLLAAVMRAWASLRWAWTCATAKTARRAASSAWGDGDGCMGGIWIISHRHAREKY